MSQNEWAHSMNVSQDDEGQWWARCACGATFGPFAAEYSADDAALEHRDQMETP